MDWRQILDRAEDAARDGRYDEALDLCNQAALVNEEARYFAGFLRGDTLLDLGDAAGALSAYDSVADPELIDTDLDCARGVALFELAMLPEAENALRSALRAEADVAEAYYTLGLIIEHTGKGGEEGLFRRARQLDPQRFPPPIHLSNEAFDQIVEEALNELPPRVMEATANIPVLVAELPSLADLRAASPPLSPASLGMFIGAPPSQVSVLDPAEAQQPVILLFKRNLERAFPERDQLKEEIQLTVVHEIGHALGLSEEELWERGLE